MVPTEVGFLLTSRPLGRDLAVLEHISQWHDSSRCREIAREPRRRRLSQRFTSYDIPYLVALRPGPRRHRHPGPTREHALIDGNELRAGPRRDHSGRETKLDYAGARPRRRARNLVRPASIRRWRIGREADLARFTRNDVSPITHPVCAGADHRRIVGAVDRESAALVVRLSRLARGTRRVDPRAEPERRSGRLAPSGAM